MNPFQTAVKQFPPTISPVKDTINDYQTPNLVSTPLAPPLTNPAEQALTSETDDIVARV